MSQPTVQILAGARMSHHRITGPFGQTFSIPISDNISTWGGNDLFLRDGEIGINEADQKVYLRIGATISLIYPQTGGGSGSVTGTPSQVLYFDSVGNVTGDEGFIRDDVTYDTIIRKISLTASATFSFGLIVGDPGVGFDVAALFRDSSGVNNPNLFMGVGDGSSFGRDDVFGIAQWTDDTNMRSGYLFDSKSFTIIFDNTVDVGNQVTLAPNIGVVLGSTDYNPNNDTTFLQIGTSNGVQCFVSNNTTPNAINSRFGLHTDQIILRNNQTNLDVQTLFNMDVSGIQHAFTTLSGTQSRTHLDLRGLRVIGSDTGSGFATPGTGTPSLRVENSNNIVLLEVDTDGTIHCQNASASTSLMIQREPDGSQNTYLGDLENVEDGTFFLIDGSARSIAGWCNEYKPLAQSVNLFTFATSSFNISSKNGKTMLKGLMNPNYSDVVDIIVGENFQNAAFIRRGDTTGTDTTGDGLIIHAGLGTGNAPGNATSIYSSYPGASGSTLNTAFPFLIIGPTQQDMGDINSLGNNTRFTLNDTFATTNLNTGTFSMNGLPGINATYSTGDGRVATVTNGIITSLI